MAEFKSDEMLNDWQTYLELRRALDAGDTFRIATMSNQEWKNDTSALDRLARDFKAALALAETPESFNHSSTHSIAYATAMSILKVNARGADTGFIGRQIQSAVNEVTRTKERMNEVRKKFFTYEGNPFGFTNEQQVENYLKQYVDMQKSGRLPDYMKNLVLNISSPNAQDEYHKMVTAAMLYKGNIDHTGAMRSSNPGWSILEAVSFNNIGSDIGKVATEIRNYASKTSKADSGRRTAAGDRQRFANKVSEAYAAAGFSGNSVESAQMSSEGMNPVVAGNTAFALDADIHSRTSDLKLRFPPSERGNIEQMVLNKDADGLRELARRFLPNDRRSVEDTINRVVKAREQAERLYAVTSKFPYDQRMQFYDTYLGYSQDDLDRLPYWENDAKLEMASKEVEAWHRSKSSAFWQYTQDMGVLGDVVRNLAGGR